MTGRQTKAGSEPRRFEELLVANLEPIRGFALAWAIQHLLASGIYDLLRDGRRSLPELADPLGFDRVRVRSLMLFLQVEGLITMNGDEAELTAAGADLAAARPWYQLLIGGYGSTFAGLGGALSRDSGILPRDDGQVGAGSCGISHYDAIPLARGLLGALDSPPAKIVDLGCGNAPYLSELASVLPGLRAVGVEPSADGHQKAAALVRSAGLADRVELLCCSAQEFAEGNLHPDADVILLGFVLHEILGQDGESGLEEFLTKLAERYRGRHLVVIEVDDRMDNAAAMRHPLARAYYNPYYLLHYFTGQRLEKREFWRDLFARLSFRLVAEDTADPEVDSTGFEFGLLLELP